jgi:hypothetical protein
MPNQNANTIYRQYNGPNMQKVMEVYDLAMNKSEQLAERRAMHLPPVIQNAPTP